MSLTGKPSLATRPARPGDELERGDLPGGGYYVIDVIAAPGVSGSKWRDIPANMPGARVTVYLPVETPSANLVPALRSSRTVLWNTLGPSWGMLVLTLQPSQSFRKVSETYRRRTLAAAVDEACARVIATRTALTDILRAREAMLAARDKALDECLNSVLVPIAREVGAEIPECGAGA